MESLSKPCSVSIDEPVMSMLGFGGHKTALGDEGSLNLPPVFSPPAGTRNQCLVDIGEDYRQKPHKRH